MLSAMMRAASAAGGMGSVARVAAWAHRERGGGQLRVPLNQDAHHGALEHRVSEDLEALVAVQRAVEVDARRAAGHAQRAREVTST